MKNILPPLNAIKVFEAAGRLQSFSAAANELNITHSAVSHQIKSLEDWFAIRLFRRAGKKTSLTEEGRIYLASISPALTAIASASKRLSSPNIVRVNALPTFTMRWLIPRLASFRTLHPDIEISLSTGLSPAESIMGDYDVVIRREPTPINSLEKNCFLPESNFPVCSPAVIESNQLKNISDLKNHTIIHTAVRESAWPDWLKHVGKPNLIPESSLHLEHLYFALQAALDGLGVAIGQSSLVAEDIANKRLVMPFGRTTSPSCGYYIIRAKETKNEALDCFCNWLKKEGESFQLYLQEILQPY